MPRLSGFAPLFSDFQLDFVIGNKNQSNLKPSGGDKAKAKLV